MKTRTKYILCILAGFAAGGILSFAYSRWSYFHILSYELTNEIFTVHKTAEDAYYDEPNDAAITKLNYSISTLQNLKRDIAERYYNNRKFATEINTYLYSLLTLENAMVGNLFKKLGDGEKAKYYFDQAISFSGYISNDTPTQLMTEEDCMKLLDTANESRKYLQDLLHGRIIFCATCEDNFNRRQQKSDFNNFVKDMNF